MWNKGKDIFSKIQHNNPTKLCERIVTGDQIKVKL